MPQVNDRPGRTAIVPWSYFDGPPPAIVCPSALPPRPETSRCTTLRSQCRLKPLVDYSRDYGVAIVAVDVSCDADFERVFRSLCETGAVLHAKHPDVMADTRARERSGWAV